MVRSRDVTDPPKRGAQTTLYINCIPHRTLYENVNDMLEPYLREIEATGPLGKDGKPTGEALGYWDIKDTGGDRDGQCECG